MCAINGEARFWQVSAYAGGVPTELPGMVLTSVGTDGATQAISSQKMVSVKDNVLYFAVLKTDKTAIYGIGRLDSNKNYGIILAKRFATTAYASHTPYGFFIQGPNFYGAFLDDATASNSRCESLNSPTRSSAAVYETLWLDEDNPTTLKKIAEAFVVTQPIGAGTALTMDIATDYGAYAAIKLANVGDFDVDNATIGTFLPKSAGIKVFKFRVSFTSSGTTTIKLIGLGWTALQEITAARK